MPTSSQHAETIVLHSGYRSDPATTAVAVPIYQTTSYQFNSTEHAGNLFALKELGNIYTRIMNPTQAVLEERVAALEGGVAALAVASGQAASLFAVQNICHAGDNFVCSTDIYGGTWNLFQNTMSTMGIECRFVDPADPDNFRKASDARTRCWYGETSPNPKLAVFPIAEVAKIGREMGIPLIMDNTACPVLCKPIEHGAAIVMHSTTKYIGGHGTSIGGIVVDGGNFDWEKHAANDFLLVSQFSVTGALHLGRPDSVGFVNGLLLVVIEWKQPGVPARAALGADARLTPTAGAGFSVVTCGRWR